MDKILVTKEMYEKLAPYFNEPEKEADPQMKELELADMPADTKKLIAAEYMRLRKRHANWKVSKAMRKAGEKYSVKFIMNE